MCFHRRPSFSRREFLVTVVGGTAGLALAGQQEKRSWRAGAVRHLLPTASHDRFLVKASFDRPLSATPVIRAGNRSARSVRLDTAGEFYSFDITNLEPEHTYQLTLHDARGKDLCDPWPLST